VSSGLLILLPSVVNQQIACPFRTLIQDIRELNRTIRQEMDRVKTREQLRSA
jgi:hypothetical protein